VSWIPASVVALAGCPGSDHPQPPPDGGPDVPSIPETSCPTGYLGDPAKDIVMDLRALKADGTDVPLASGGDLAIIFPPQGGRVAFVGVHATNLDGCGVQITGALRDKATGQLRLDGRTVNLRRESDGYGTTGEGASTDLANSSAIGDYSNIPLCPNQWASTDIFDQVFELEVLVQDVHGKKSDLKIDVTPRCAEPGDKETACKCLCKVGYVLGETCGEDAGTDAAPE